MPRYFYIAKSLKGKEKSGVLEAKSVSQLAQILHGQGFVLVRATSEAERLKKKVGFSLPFLGVPLAEKMFFTRNLQVMVSAGLPLPRAIETLSRQTKSKRFRAVLLEIKEKVVKGENFSDALSHYPDIFSELYQNMIRVGEESGTMEKALGVLASQMERKKDIESKIKGAMLYPSVIISVMIVIGILMLVVVVPKLTATFEDLKIQLPPTTRFVIGTANFLTEKWYIAISILFFLLFVLWKALKTKSGKRIFDLLMLKTPIVSHIIKNANSASTARTLGSLISAGVALPRSLEITSRTLGNSFYRNTLSEAAKRVRKGEKLSHILEPHKDIYPLTVIQMISVGEETGRTSPILLRLADFYEEEVSNATKNLSAVIEPILILIIGAVIGFFAVSMIQPMYSMLGAIK